MRIKFIRPLLLSSILFVFVSCQKEIGKKADSSDVLHESNGTNKSKKIHVTSVHELYAAVNDPANEGSQVVLEPGLYLLNASYPNGGRLELQTDMTLAGKPGDSDDVIIDMSALPTGSFVIPAGRTGGIRMGKGKNSLEWLTIVGGLLSANPFSVINTDLLSTETTIEISHSIINCNGSNIGVNLRNRLAEHAGRKIYASLEHNEITGATSLNGLALAVQNANGASGALIDLKMRGNYIHGNKIGILAFSSAQNSSISDCKIQIESHADRIEGNGTGIDPSAGVNQAATTTSNNNSTTIIMHGSTIRNNNPSPLPPELKPVNGALPGGIYAACAYNSVNNITGFNRASNNSMTLEFWGCDISDNGTDIYAIAAFCQPAALLAGSNNLLEIFLHGVSTNAIVDVNASIPAEPAGTNVVNVVRN